MSSKIFVTKPSLPSLNEYTDLLKEVWSNKILTNNGPYTKKFEQELKSFLDVKYISLVSNATIGLMIAQKALNFKNEIITTPFSFIATAHSLKWNNCTPVFADTDKETGNLDVQSVKKMFSPLTGGILAVHNYGLPGQISAIESIARDNKIPLIFDAAPAFGVKYKDKSILEYGDLSVLSFHATKVFTSFEGGAIISHTQQMKNKIDRIKNFSIVNENTISGIGINGKMNELQSAMGLLQLKHVNENIEKRKIIFNTYSDAFQALKQIRTIKIENDLKYNFAYYPIFLNSFKIREKIYKVLKNENIICRKYWFL